MKRQLLAVLLIGVLSVDCNLFSSATSPSSTGGSTTEVFSQSLPVGGSSVYTFTVTTAGTVTVDLTSFGTAVAVGLGLGTSSGTGSTSCTLTSSSPSTLAGSTPQISVTENPGTYCVEIYDVGTLTAATSFSISIVHT